MRYERATFEAASRALAIVGIVILEMQIYPLTEKPQSDGECLSIFSISLGWIENHAYKAFSVTKVKLAIL